MPDVRYLRAGPRALPLLQDLLEQTLSTQPADVAAMWADDFAALLLEEEEPDIVYILGFTDHSPFGYVKCLLSDLTLEVVGPCLFPECDLLELAEGLLAQARELAALRERGLLFCLCPRTLTAIADALHGHGFEEVADDVSFIKRWRDGLLADRLVAATSTLYARLVDDT